MTDIKIDISLVDAKTAVADTSVDYVPFGIKVLKLQIRKIDGPNKKVWIRTKSFKRDEDPCAIYGYADDGEDLWAVWGAGDIMGFCAKYEERAGTKKAVPLDDNEPHTVYFHLIHRPTNPAEHQLRTRQVTIVAVTTDDDVNDLAKKRCGERQHHDRVIAEKTFTLTVPQGAENAIRPIWTRRSDGSGSHIAFSGKAIPRYVSRWWPAREVTYTTVVGPPDITLDYVRKANGDEGAVDIWLKTDDGRVRLARVEGHLTLPLHDLRWFAPELYRFYDDETYVLRLVFFWADENIDADDLLAYVPDDEKGALHDEATKEANDIMQPGGLFAKWRGWGKQYEIPDVERFDIVFNPDRPAEKFGCTDAHWREYWVKFDPGQACRCSIAAPQDAYKVVLNHFLRHFRHFHKQEPKPITNPLEEGGIAAVITAGRCIYDPNSGRIVCGEKPPVRPRAPGLLGKNAPTLENANLLDDGLSSDVLEG
jgi:hypothetical protein